MRFRFSLAAPLLAAQLQAVTYAADSQQYTIISRGHQTGSMVVNRDAASVSIDYSYRENGRGPTSKERLELDGDGLPRKWSIALTTHFGGKLSEEFTVSSRQARWSIAGKAESAPLTTPKLYTAAFASPWSIEQYVRVLRRVPDQRMDTLPTGSLRVEKLRDLTLAGTDVTAYVLINAEGQRQLAVVDRDGELFATLREGVVVRAGKEAATAELEELGREVQRQRYADFARRLSHRFDEPVHVRNVRVFDPETGTLGNSTCVVFFRGIITGVHPHDERLRKGDRSVDGAGGTLVPGLHDLHSHGGAASEGQMLDIAAGVTTVRDMGSPPDTHLDLIARIHSGELIGPRILSSGFIDGPGANASHTGVIANTQAEALDAIRYYAARGYIQTKIYNSIPAAWVPAMVQESHRLGMRVAGHVSFDSTPQAMIEAGYDELTHINQLMLGWLLRSGEDPRTPMRLTALKRAADLDLTSASVTRVIESMKEHDVPLDSTISIMERLMLSRDGEVQQGDAAFIDHVAGPARMSRMVTLMPIKNAQDDRAYRAGFEKMLQLLRRIHEAGIKIYPGTDDANGFTLHRELELYVRAGMTPAEALTRATLDSARYLGHDSEWGSIARGKAADFILVAGDPTRDISAIRQIRMTVAAGTVYFPAEIHQALGIKPFTQSPIVSVVN